MWKVGETTEEEQSGYEQQHARSRSDSSAMQHVTGYNVSAWVDERMLRVVSRVVCSWWHGLSCGRAVLRV